MMVKSLTMLFLIVVISSCGGGGDDKKYKFLETISVSGICGENHTNIKDKYSGFSDHTLGIVAPIVAMSRGAKIIEKHFTTDKSMYGPDHSGSMTPHELNELVKYKEQILQCL